MSSSVWELGEDSLQDKVNKKAGTLFKARLGRPQLEVIRATGYLDGNCQQLRHSVKIEDISDISELKELNQVSLC